MPVVAGILVLLMDKKIQRGEALRRCNAKRRGGHPAGIDADGATAASARGSKHRHRQDDGHPHIHETHHRWRQVPGSDT